MNKPDNYLPVAALRMRRFLYTSITPPTWPDGIFAGSFGIEKLEEVYTLLLTCYTNGEGVLPAFDTWKEALMNDEEFDPRLCFMLYNNGVLTGIAQCWASGFIKDFAIHPRSRNRGLGKLLLLYVFYSFKQRGLPFVDLKVYENNLPAINLYSKSGMQVVERIV